VQGVRRDPLDPRGAHRTALPTGASASADYIGSRPGTDDWRVVGTVAYLRSGRLEERREMAHRRRGNAEMQAQIGQSSYEITVQMDSASDARSSGATARASRSASA